MHVNRFDAVERYNAPRHNGCVSYRLQGAEASPLEDFWIGISHFLPDGGAERDASPFEKV